MLQFLKKLLLSFSMQCRCNRWKSSVAVVVSGTATIFWRFFID